MPARGSRGYRGDRSRRGPRVLGVIVICVTVLTVGYLATVAAGPEARAQVMQLVSVFEGKIVDIGLDRMTVMLAGPPAKIDDFEDLMRPIGIAELQRTGRVALPKLERRSARLHSVETTNEEVG